MPYDYSYYYYYYCCAPSLTLFPTPRTYQVDSSRTPRIQSFVHCLRPTAWLHLMPAVQPRRHLLDTTIMN